MESIFKAWARENVQTSIGALVVQKRYRDALNRVEEIRRLTGDSWYVVDEEGHSEWEYATLVAAGLVGKLLNATPAPPEDERAALVGDLERYATDLDTKADEVGGFRATDVMLGHNVLEWVHLEVGFIHESAQYEADADSIRSYFDLDS